MRLSVKHWTLLILLAVVALAPLVFPSSFYYRVFSLIFINALLDVAKAMAGMPELPSSHQTDPDS